MTVWTTWSPFLTLSQTSEAVVLLKVGIDPEAGLELAEGVKGPGRILVRRLTERCVLVAESGASARQLQEAFRYARSAELSQVIALLIKTRLELPDGRGGSSLPVPIRRIESAQDVASWRDLADLLLISKLRAEWLDLQGGSTTPEVANLREALNADAFERIESDWRRTVPVGENRETVWRDVFAPLAARTVRVYIVDGYLATNLYRSLNAGARGGVKSGAEWFLGHLARSNVRTIHVACSERHVRSGHYDPVHVRDVIDRWFRGTGSGTDLDLRIVGGTFPHTRRVAFDGWAGFELHKGLASFEGAKLTEIATLNASLDLANEVQEEFQDLC